MDVGGAGTLSGVEALTTDGHFAVCALLISGGVDCWGNNYDGQLGNGTFSTSASPVQVDGVGGTGTLSGVAALTGVTASGNDSFCALLASGGVDCWGWGVDGELGDGTFSSSTTPVQVEGVGGNGTLTGVVALATDVESSCALLASGGVDCWGIGYFGELGDGTFYTTGNEGSATPVQVEGVGGNGTLSGVVALTAGGYESYCALLPSGGVDCWGYGYYGELGDGTFYTTGNHGSATPVQVRTT